MSFRVKTAGRTKNMNQRQQSNFVDKSNNNQSDFRADLFSTLSLYVKGLILNDLVSLNIFK